MLTRNRIGHLLALVALTYSVSAQDETFVVQKSGTRLTLSHPFVKCNWEEGLAGFSTALYYAISNSSWQYCNDPGITLRDSLPDGHYTVYMDSSYTHLLMEAAYLKGARTGEWVYYYPNKRPAYKVHYIANELEGIATAYDYKGRIISTQIYAHNKLDGAYTYDCNGSFLKCTFNSGKMNGTVEARSNFYDLPVKQSGLMKDDIPVDSLLSTPALGKSFKSSALLDAMDPVYRERTVWLQYKSDTQFVAQLQLLKQRRDILQLHITLESKAGESKTDSLLTVFLPYLKAQSGLRLVWIDGGRKNVFPSALYELTTVSTIWFYAGARRYYPGEAEEDDTIQLPFNTSIVKMTGLTTLWVERDFTRNQMQQLVKILAQVAALRTLHFLDYYDFNPLPVNLHLLTGLKELAGLHVGDADSEAIRALYKLKKLEHLDVEPYSDSKNWFDSLFVHLPLCQVTVFRTCFPAGTLVKLADGSLEPIEKVKIGERVLAFDTAAYRIDTATVTKLFNSGANQKPLLTLDFATAPQQHLTCTFNHPLFVKGKGYLPAELVQPGDWLVMLNGNSAKEVRVTGINRSAEVQQVYNIETTTHNYFAGNILVHNK